MFKSFLFALFMLLFNSFVLANSSVQTADFTIRGENLSIVTSVQVDGMDVPFKILSDTEIVIDKPPAALNPLIISVLSPGGSMEFKVSVENIHEDHSKLSLLSISPTSGSAGGGWSATLKGKGFSGKKIEVFFGGVRSESVEVNSDEVISLIVPPHHPGLVDVELRSEGRTDGVLPLAVVYEPQLAIKSVTPSLGSVMGGTKVTLIGDGFKDNGQIRVLFGHADAKNIVIKNGQMLEAESPAYIAGTVDISVINPDGQRSNLKSGFRYLPMPVIRSVGSSP